MNGPCKEFTDRIVDYVDGELPAAEAQTVAQHLTTCGPCRRTAEALNRSLDLAKVLWTGNLDNKGVRATFSQRFRGIRIYAVAASVLVAASVFVFVVANRHSRPSMRFEDIQRQIADAGAAAELLAATQILARCEGTEAIIEEQRRYILSNYPGTPAAATLLDSSLFRRN
jgi:anti-sigma factor RsiW